jgi:hypothetical protein
VSTYPGAPPPTHPPGFGQSQLVLVLREPVGSMGMISPVVTIDGYPAPARWGPNPFPTTPGRHQVRVSNRYLYEYGAAEQVVDVAPGQSLEVHYSPPLVTFVRGRIGFAPQGRPGLGVLIAILVALLAVVIGVIAFAALLD